MTARRQYPTKAEIKRAVAALGEAAQNLGVVIKGVEMTPDGTIRLLDSESSAPSAYARWKQGQANDRGSS